MRRLGTVFAVLALVCFFAVRTQAADKEVTLKGKLMCGKCELKQSRKCATVIKVREGDRDVVYWLLDRGNEETWHEEVCGGGQKDGTVTGTVFEKDGKKWVRPKKVEYAKE